MEIRMLTKTKGETDSDGSEVLMGVMLTDAPPIVAALVEAQLNATVELGKAVGEVSKRVGNEAFHRLCREFNELPEYKPKEDAVPA